MELPENYEALSPWSSESPQSDSEGWKYSRNFLNSSWTTDCQSDSLVRRRIWHRVLVHISDISTARDGLNKFYSLRCSYRAMNFQMINRALVDYPHQYQVIYEFQRLSDGIYSKSRLTSSDPPAWATRDNPIHDYISNSLDYVPINNVSFNCPHGWVVLHEFNYSIDPQTDEVGWEYSNSINFENSISDNSIGLLYRRRKWFRTLVQVTLSGRCQTQLSTYISAHPRGVIKQGNLYKKLSFQQIWLSSSITLLDNELYLSNSQETKRLNLNDLELISMKSHECLGYQLGFSLRKKAYDNSISDVICSLASENIHEGNQWIFSICHQIALININFNSFYFGPIITDPVILCDDMFKRSDILLIWRLRTLQLHQSGLLIYYHGAQKRDRIDINGCRLYPYLNLSSSSTTSLSNNLNHSERLLSTSIALSSEIINPYHNDHELSFTVSTSRVIYLSNGSLLSLSLDTLPLSVYSPPTLSTLSSR